MGDAFAYMLILLNAGAALGYGLEGNTWKTLYWLAAMTLNVCILKMR